MMSKAKSKRRNPRVLVLGMVLFMGALISGQACAQAAVIDAPLTLKTVFAWIAQYEQMVNDQQQQYSQLKAQIKQYEQMQVNGDVYGGKPGYREMFKARNVNTGVDKRCTQKQSANPVAPEQYDYCVAIVQTENRRFNAMVNVLEGVKKRDDELKAAMLERKDVHEDEPGKLASNNNRILALQSQLQNDIQNAQTLMSAYDAAIRTLKDDQILAGNRALSGHSSLLGDATQGVALKVALKVARMRDR